MTKPKKKDASCFSFSALVRHVLMDHKPHPIEEIAAHIQKFMCKTNTLLEIQSWIKNLLDQDKELQKVKTGYVLKTGESMMELAEKLLAETDAPLAMDDIVQFIAKEQGVPPEAVEVDLDDDKRFIMVEYRGKPFYYLSARKKINNKVYEILKAKGRALSYSEIYKILESEYDLQRNKVIFLAREDTKIKRQQGSKFALKSQTTRKKPEEPIHNVTSDEMDLIVQHLKDTANRFSASILSETILNRPLDKTNLNLKLARESRLKREGDLYYIEENKQPIEIPQKLHEAIDNSYYKVKARMVGSNIAHSIDNLLERIYKVNVSHLEYTFYKQLLVARLSDDDGTVKLLDGWIRAAVEPRVAYSQAPEFTAPAMPDPPPPTLDLDSLSPVEKEFVETHPVSLDMDNGIARLTFDLGIAARRLGVLHFPSEYADFFPARPLFYEILLLDKDKTTEFRAFVHLKNKTMTDLDQIFDQYLPLCGGKLRITPTQEDQFHFIFEIVPNDIDSDIKLERISQLMSLAAQDLNLVNLIIRILKENDSPVSIHQIALEISAVRSVSNMDLLRVIKDFICFSAVADRPGYYQYNASAGLRRRSIKKEEPVPAPEPVAPVAEVPEPSEIITGKDETPILETERESIEQVLVESSPSVASPLTQAKKKERRRQVEESELPEHLMRLKSFERKLPGIESSKTLVVKPAAGNRGRRIAAASAGRIEQTGPLPSKKLDESDIPMVMEIPPFPENPIDWSPAAFVNPEKSSGHSDLHMTLEVLKAFVSRPPIIRKTDGSIVIFLDSNNVAIYFRIPPENPNCWIAWISETDLKEIDGGDAFLYEHENKAKYSQKGYWWATEKFRGPRGNWKDKNVLESVQIVSKIIDLLEKQRKNS